VAIRKSGSYESKSFLFVAGSVVAIKDIFFRDFLNFGEGRNV
jgi:hypothetical protein